MFLYGFLFQFVFSLSGYYIKFLEGNRMMAFYSFASQGTMTVVSLFSSFIGSFAPKIYFNCTSGIKQEHLLKKITIIIMFLAYIASFVVFTYSRFFINLILPVYAQSISIFEILAFMIIPFAQYNIAYIVAIGENKVALLIKGMIIMIPIAIFLNWLFYKYWGVDGIAFVAVIIAILSYVFVSIVVSSSYKLWYYSPLLFLSLIGNLLMYHLNPIFGLIYLVLVSSIFFLLIMKTFRAKEQ